jgi:hypothetical protein
LSKEVNNIEVFIGRERPVLQIDWKTIISSHGIIRGESVKLSPRSGRFLPSSLEWNEKKEDRKKERREVVGERGEAAWKGNFTNDTLPKAGEGAGGWAG